MTRRPMKRTRLQSPTVCHHSSWFIDFQEANGGFTVDLSSIKPSTDLERYLLKMLQAAEEKNVELQRQFDQYKARVQNTFLNILADDGR